MVDAKRAGVLLVNTGSPSEPTPAAVKRYLAQFLMDPNVRPLPAPLWWAVLHAFILPKRQYASAEKYRQIWTDEGSPLLASAMRLALHVESLLRERYGEEAPLVRAAMSYGEPSVGDAVRELRAVGVERLLVIPLYPQSARSTSGSVVRRVRAELERLGWEPGLATVESYGDEPLYLDALADSVRDAGFDAARDRAVFSFHSVPRSDVEAGDTYPQQVSRTCGLLADRLGLAPEHWEFGFQSPFEDSRTWLDPFTVDWLRECAASAQGDVYLVCPGFSLDCLETLYDVEHELRPVFDVSVRAAADGSVPPRLIYVPCLNAGDAQVRLMAKLIEDRL